MHGAVLPAQVCSGRDAVESFLGLWRVWGLRRRSFRSEFQGLGINFCTVHVASSDGFVL